MRAEKPRTVEFDIHVRVNDREVRTFFQKQQMSQPVVNFVVPHSHDIRRKEIHDINGRDPFKLTVDQRASEHVPRDRIQNIFLFISDFVDITGKHGNTADQF